MINKKGIELGLNFIVVLILAIVVFILGISFLIQILTGAEDILKRAEPRINDELGKQIANGEVVAVYPTTLSLHRGESDIFGVQFFNKYSEPKYIALEWPIDIISESVADPSRYITIAHYHRDYSLEAYHSFSSTKPYLFLVRVSRQTPAGTYIIDLNPLMSDDNVAFDQPYPPRKKVYVTVP